MNETNGPTERRVRQLIAAVGGLETFAAKYSDVFEAIKRWRLVQSLSREKLVEHYAEHGTVYWLAVGDLGMDQSVRSRVLSRAENAGLVEVSRPRGVAIDVKLTPAGRAFLKESQAGEKT